MTMMSMYISFAGIASSIIFFYNTQQSTAWYFEGQFIEDYQYVVGKQLYYPQGLMVSQPAAMAILIIIGSLISWVIHTAIKEKQK